MRNLLLATFVTGFAAALPLAAIAANPQVEIKTSMGSMTVELYEDKAPKTVENFLTYVKAGHYNGTIFHRVIPGFMIQAGGYSKDLYEKPTRPPIEHEGAKCGSNDLGTIAMARTGDPHSATSQFFVNVVNNSRLNYTLPPNGWGYCAFGRVVKGMDVAQKIVAVPTVAQGQHQNLPKDAITIESISLVTK
jgi:cyclophilin family peptidyl-prolyl cis-trans isomerase